MIQARPTDTAFPFTLTLNQGQTGKTVLVQLRRGNEWWDFNDDSFKDTGWTTRQATATEVNPTISPGHYEYEFDITKLNAVSGDPFNIEYEITNELYVSERLLVVDDTSLALINAINAQTEQILAAFSSTDCVRPPTQLPTVYTGHKGDPQNLPVFRGSVLMDDAELVGATGLVINFFNRDTQTNVPITANITTGSGFVTYTTASGDGVYETAGRWEAQAEGVSATGQPFRSQIVYTTVRDELQ